MKFPFWKCIHLLTSCMGKKVMSNTNLHKSNASLHILWKGIFLCTKIDQREMSVYITHRIGYNIIMNFNEQSWTWYSICRDFFHKPAMNYLDSFYQRGETKIKQPSVIKDWSKRDECLHYITNRIGHNYIVSGIFYWKTNRKYVMLGL